MKKIFLSLLFIFNLKANSAEKKELFSTNIALTISIYNLFHDYKLPIQETKAFYRVIIEKLALDKDLFALHSLKNKLEKLSNKENRGDINFLQFEIDNQIEIIKLQLLPIL